MIKRRISLNKVKVYYFHNILVKNFKKYTVKFEGQPEPGIDW